MGKWGSSTTRRRLMSTGTAIGGVALTFGGGSAQARGGQFRRGRPSRIVSDHPIIADHPMARAAEAMRIRLSAARNLLHGGRGETQTTNGDEGRYDDYRAVFTKTLPHDDLGEVDKSAYRRLLDALRQRTDRAFDAIPLAPQAKRKLANPQAAYGYVMAGLDTQACRMRAAPAFASDETAGEMHELYWKALLRDTPFRRFGSDGLVDRAITDLNAGPATAGGHQTASTVFRGPTAGDRTGPMVSQLLWRDVPFGNSTITQRYPSPSARADWGSSYDEWLEVQRGGVPSAAPPRGARFIYDGRSLAEYVHTDFTYQAFLNAGLILLGLGPSFLAEGNPTRTRATTGGFVSFGAADIVDAIASGANAALHAAWFQKWAVHRRLRPETYGGRLHNQLRGAKDYELPRWLGESEALGRTQRRHGTALLSQAYAEGSPTHPAYPAGHAAIAGACCTILKAFFNEGATMPAPVQANASGTALDPYAGDLTVGGEINKLASNISLGRDWAGVHYRSDGIDGMLVGEDVGLALLADRAACYADRFDGFTLTTFGGRRVQITARGIV